MDNNSHFLLFNSIIRMQNIDDHTDTESDSQVLLPITSLFPPNELITKKYSPDTKPTFKLLKQQQRQKQRKIPTSQEIKIDYYNDIFTQNDSLGYEYNPKIKRNLIYLKFNNSEYMKLMIKNKAVRYFAGLFIPLENLVNQEIKKTRNVYKTLEGIQFVDYKNHYESSFGNNCFCQAPFVRFSSNYESGNLFAAFKKSEYEYDLILQNDINSKGNTQWFNFTAHLPEDKTYKFNIINLTKSASLYQQGMQVIYYSQLHKIYGKQGWSRGCQNIQYFQNNINREDSDSLYYYTLHFQFQGLYKNDYVTFSYGYPYTSLDVEKYFNKVLYRKMLSNLKLEKIKIAQTLSGAPVYLYNLTNKKSVNSKKQLLSSNSQNQPLPKSVIFMARQHPGQSQSNYVLEGIIDFLIQSNDYDHLKRQFNYFFVPIVNHDGVFYGNYRTNLSGNDLNRVWRNPRREYHSEIYYLKKYFHSINKISPINLIIDIHGHSSSLNSFFYGNPIKKDGNGQLSNQNPKLFPYFCSKRVKQISFSQSTFSISEDKKNCARVVLSQMFPKALIYTFENSFYGWRRGRSIVEYTIDSYRRLGKDIMQSFLQFSRLIEKNSIIKQKWTKEIDQYLKQRKSHNHADRVYTESDSEAEQELIELIQPETIRNEDNFFKNSWQSSSDDKIKKQLSSSYGKNRFLKYIRKNKPTLKTQKQFKSSFVVNYDKNYENASSESQGFLSIIKINTKSTNEIPFNAKSFNPKIQTKNSRKNILMEAKKVNFHDEVKQRQNTTKENNQPFKNVKMAKLINEKQMILDNLKQKKTKLEKYLFGKNRLSSSDNNQSSGFAEDIIQNIN